MLITGTGRRRDEDVAADSPVRWGILGTGGIATTFVTDLGLTDSGVAVAVGSRSQGSADRFADGFGIANRHASYELLVADPDVEVIYVATPHPMHHDDAILALRAGKHVLVEKRSSGWRGSTGYSPWRRCGPGSCRTWPLSGTGWRGACSATLSP
jgi:hypothetical protein